MTTNLEPSSLERAVAASANGITIADATRPGFPLTFVNAAFEAMTGYAAGECVGRNCKFLQGTDTGSESVAAIAHALRERRDHREVLLNYRKDGTPFYNELRLSPVFAGDGTYAQVIGVQNDVTELVSAQRAVQAERDYMRGWLLRAGDGRGRPEHGLAELRILQKELTPEAPGARPHLELAAAFTPAEDGVAGDFYLVAGGRHESTILVVGDVMGHGLSAARRAAHVRTALATFARFTDDPLQLLEMTNYAVLERAGACTEFTTAVCATYRPHERTLTWALAGHPPPLDLATGEALEVERAGVPLGVDIELGATRSQRALAPGDGLLLYTDGLIEARPAATARGAEQTEAVAPLGERAVASALRGFGAASPAEVVASLRAQAIAHSRGRVADDLCLLALRVAA